MSGKLALWGRLKTLLGEALEAERSRIPSGQAEHVASFLQANEFGLAFDELEYALDEAGLVPTNIGRAALDQAADLMGIARAGEIGRAAR